jgi:hypothetical protein
MDAGGYCWEGADLILRARVQPRARRDHWAGLQDDRFRIHVAAPPADGRANARLRELLAGLFGVARSQVTLLAGEAGRDKRLRIAAPKRLPPGIEPPAAPGRPRTVRFDNSKKP